MSEDKKTIDLSKFTQRELIRETYRKVIEMESQLKVYTETNMKLQLKVNTLETKMALYAVICGVAGSGLVEIGIYLITKTK